MAAACAGCRELTGRTAALEGLVARVAALEELVARLVAPGSPAREPEDTAPWQKAVVKGKYKSSISLHPRPLALSNKYDLLSMDDFPPPPTSSPVSISAPTVHPPAAAPAVAGGRGGGHPPRVSATTTLVVGDSLVRGVVLPGVPDSETLCFPGARVRSLSRRLPAILDNHPGLQRIIIHVGTNDIRARTSEILARDYIAMLDATLAKNVKVIVSGPLPTHRSGNDRWARLWGYHLRLQQICVDKGLQFVDNFKLFNCNEPWFKRDGLHLLPEGTRQFSMNITKVVNLIQPSSPRVSPPPLPLLSSCPEPQVLGPAATAPGSSLPTPQIESAKCVVDAVDSSGKTALHHAVASGSVPVVQLLCEHKSSVNLRDAEGLCPLLLSARHGHAEVLSMLLDWGADVNACDNNGRTAVMLASEGGSVAVVEVLVRRGADLQAADSLGHDVLHYASLASSSQLRSLLQHALHTDGPSPRTPQHDQAARLSDDRSTTPKKRKAPPPPNSPLQTSGLVSPPYLTPSATPRGTPLSSKADTSRRFNYQEEELRGVGVSQVQEEELRGVSVALRGEVERLQEEKSMLLETIEDLRQILDQTGGAGAGAQARVEVSGSAASALVQNLQARITTLSLENQQLAQILKKRPSPQGGEEGESSRPSSMASNASYHSTHEGFDPPPATQAPPPGQTTPLQPEEESEVSIFEVQGEGKRDEEEEEEEEGRGGGGGGEEEIRLLRQTLLSVQTKLLESRKHNRSLQAQLTPRAGGKEERGREAEGGGVAEERGRSIEEEVLESLAELQAKLTETQERYHLACEELEGLRAQLGRGGGGGEAMEEQTEIHRQTNALEQEVKSVKAQLGQSAAEQERAEGRIRELEAAAVALEAGLGERHREAQEEIRMLQEALRGTVPVEAAARDFEDMKTELSEVIAGLQRRLLELSHSYSETRGELSSTRSQLDEALASQAPASPHQEDLQGSLASKLEELQAAVAEAEKTSASSRQEAELLRQEAELQVQSSVSLADHTQVVASLGTAIKELEAEAEALRQQLSQKALQVDVLQNRLTVEKEVTPDDSVSRLEHQQMREGLEAQVAHLTQLLQGALRKQDEMALEAAGAWQEARDGRAEREAQQEALVLREKEVASLSARLAEALDGVAQLKNLVESHVSSEREKNKRIDDLSREVGKLKDALNSLSQMSYSSSSSPKRQQNQQLETMQQQVKQLQYQLAESKKQHHEIISVYRMHLLYAVQGQMDEDVQKALKQILMMCKMPAQTKSSC